MAETENSGGSAVPVAAQADRSRPSTPNPNRVQALANQEARNKSNTSTPRTIRSNGALMNVTDLREEIALQMDGEFQECSVEDFIRHYLMFLPDDEDVDTLVDSATYTPASPRESPVPAQSDTGRSTRAATRKSPSPPAPTDDEILELVDGKLRSTDYNVLPTTPSEAMTYSDFKKIFDVVGGAIVTGRDRNRFRYHPCPDSLITSETPGSNNKIDGCIISSDCVSSNDKVDLRTTGIAVAFEFKLKSSQTIKNNQQVVSANVQLMNDDVRRMFTYGITVVGEEVTLWYHGRSHSAVSEPFSFIEEPKLFIKVAMSFLFATEVELGYDPTITRLPNKRLVFQIPDGEGNPSYYRTVRTLTDYRTNNITGRMTRVWEVEQVSEPNETAQALSHGVLKDVWLDADAPTERQVQESIYKAIEERKATIQTNKSIQELVQPAVDEITDLVQSGHYKKFFLTFVADFVGQVSKTVVPSAQRKHGLLLPELKSVGNVTGEVNADRASSHTHQPTQIEQINAARKAHFPRQWKQKRQYRAVYAEHCVTVGRLTTLGEALDVLSQTLVALRLLFFAGWVHRDISTGNVMAYKTSNSTGWQAKLCDLEYAKQYSIDPSATSQDPKTGTPYFMANEVLWNQPLLPEPPKVKESTSTPIQQGNISKTHRNEDVSDLIADVASVSNAKAANPKIEKPMITVIPSFQHDLESIWWLTMYTVTARVDHQPSNEFAKKVFQHATNLSLDRSVCLEKPIKDALRDCLHEDIAGIAAVLDHMRVHLLEQYHERNSRRLLSHGVDDTETYTAIHNEFWRAFTALSQIKKNAKVANFPLIDERRHAEIMPTPQPRKRARSICADDDDYIASSDNGENSPVAGQPKGKAKGSKKAKNTAE